MKRYYVLTERGGITMVHASGVDETSPFLIRFPGALPVDSFERDDLLWWGPVECVQDGPFANFGPRHPRAAAFDPFNFSADWHSPKSSHSVLPDRQLHVEAVALRCLVHATLAVVPRRWSAASLDLKVTFDLGSRAYAVTHRLRNLETREEAVDFSDALFAAITVFHRVELEAGRNWNASALTLKMIEPQRWNSTVEYSYGTNFASR